MSDIAQASSAPVGAVPSRRPRLTRLWQTKSGLAGTIIVSVAIILAVLAALGLTPYGPTAQDPTVRFQSPTAAYPLGTDQFGRDVLSRIMSGLVSSLLVAVSSVAIAASIGTLVGLVAGFFGEWIDRTIMRINDVFFAFPAILLALAIVSALGSGWRNTALAIGIVFIPLFVRVARGPVLALREVDYIQAARVLGFSRSRILLRHLLPNLGSAVIVQVALALSWAIITESSLSFLGLGTQPPMPSLGLMVSDGRNLVGQGAWLLIAPSAAIVIVVVGLNLLGDGLRDVLDPKDDR